MNKTQKILNRVLAACFILYLIFLLWDILFRYVSFSEVFSLERINYRTINLIPYADFVQKDFDVFGNLIIFIPLGIFLCIYSKDAKIWPKALAIFLFSMALETFQFIFALDVADITIVINNMIGGLLGIGIYILLKKAMKDDTKVKSFMAIFTVVMLALFFVIWASINLTS